MFALRILERKVKLLFNIENIRNYSSQRIGILGAPFSKGQRKEGVEKAPDALRNYGLIEQLCESGLDVKDYGNLNLEYTMDYYSENKIRFPEIVGAACQAVSNAVRNVLHDKRKCVTIGGDHSLGTGTVHGHAQEHDVCLLWIDAHADINTTETTYSGNMHGMSISFLLNELHNYNNHLPGFEWSKPCLKASNLAYIGLRDIDPLEKLILKKLNIAHYSMRDIDKLGIFEVLNRALATINPKSNLSLHVSFDIDSICGLTAPSTGTPVIGGLTVREALSIGEEISSLSFFRALDVVEINPILGTKEESETTVHVAATVIKSFLGHTRDGMLPADITEIPTA